MTDTPTPGTRERLIAAMTDALRRRGLHGIGLTELLAQAGAPKGVLYHHFPGGKTELAVAAIDDVVARMLRGLDTLLAQKTDPIEATRRWMAGATGRLSETGFESGCPHRKTPPCAKPWPARSPRCASASRWRWRSTASRARKHRASPRSSLRPTKGVCSRPVWPRAPNPSPRPPRPCSRCWPAARLAECLTGDLS